MTSAYPLYKSNNFKLKKQMIHQQVKLEKYNDWLIDVYYGVTRFHVNTIMDKLHEIGCDGRSAKKAYENLSSGDLNTGLTYSNYEKRHSIMVVGVADSPEQFINSLTHEQAHVMTHIAKTFDIDMYGEEVCYLIGKIAQATFVVAKNFMCECECCINKVQDML